MGCADSPSLFTIRVAAGPRGLWAWAPIAVATRGPRRVISRVTGGDASPTRTPDDAPAGWGGAATSSNFGQNQPRRDHASDPRADRMAQRPGHEDRWHNQDPREKRGGGDSLGSHCTATAPARRPRPARGLATRRCGAGRTGIQLLSAASASPSRRAWRIAAAGLDADCSVNPLQAEHRHGSRAACRLAAVAIAWPGEPIGSSRPPRGSVDRGRAASTSAFPSGEATGAARGKRHHGGAGRVESSWSTSMAGNRPSPQRQS